MQYSKKSWSLGYGGIRAMEGTEECIYCMDSNTPWKCSFLICETRVPKTFWHMIKLRDPAVFNHLSEWQVEHVDHVDQLEKKYGTKKAFPCGNSSSEVTITWIFKRFVHCGSILQCLEIRTLQKAFGVWLRIKKNKETNKKNHKEENTNGMNSGYYPGPCPWLSNIFIIIDILKIEMFIYLLYPL